MGRKEKAGANRAPLLQQDFLPAQESRTELERALAEVCKTDGWTGESVRKALRFDTLLDLLPRSDRAAIAGTDGRNPITHSRLRSFIRDEFDLTQFGITRKDRCGLVMPNGPELGVALLAVATYCCCAPVNIQNTPEEIEAELLNVGCRAVIVASPGSMEGAGRDLHALCDRLKVAGLTVLLLQPSPNEAGIFDLVGARPAGRPPARERTQRTDIVLVLHTSGTSGKKKVVPYPLENVCVGAACVAAAWAMTADDVNLNMMPLFHIGGIARNLFAVVLSGGQVVLTKGFDAALFWDLVGPTSATWYYAGPTMHHMILQAGKARPEGIPRHRIRMICNAAGGLLPTLAIELRDTFNGATVLPSYGMTECMPISSPPVSYRLDRPGTSGKACGPELSIRDDAGVPVPSLAVGNICVRGAPLFPGYENDPKATASAFFPGGWFNTGDMGYMDDDGYLYVTGRSKEVINRGGEIISPFEVEEALLPHPQVGQVIAFSMPHDVFQEVVGVVVVPAKGAPRPSLASLQKFCGAHLHPAKWPQAVIYMEDLPKGQTNKPQRIRIAERCGLKDLSDTTPASLRHFEAAAPAKGVGLGVPIATRQCSIDRAAVAAAMARIPGVAECAVLDGMVPGHADHICGYASAAMAAGGAGAQLPTPETLTEALEGTLHGYMIPHHLVVLPGPLPRLANGAVDVSGLPVPSRLARAASTKAEITLHAIWQDVLGTDEEIGVDEDFFAAGGSSLLAGMIIARCRKAFGVSLGMAAVFEFRTIATLGEEVEKRVAEATVARQKRMSMGAGSGSSASLKTSMASLPTCGDSDDDLWKAGGASLGSNGRYSKLDETDAKEKLRPASQSSFWALFIQALPVAFFFPTIRWVKYVVWVSTLSLLRSSFEREEQTLSPWELLGSLYVAHIINSIGFPIFGIIFKWMVMGRYRAGNYRLWGSYYLRWWITKQVLNLCGKGVFQRNDWSVALYLRLLGAKIGKGAKVDKRARISEWDLVTIGANTCIDSDAIVCPFHMDQGAMLLRAIHIGDDCALAAKVFVAGGHFLPSGTCLGPCSSSYELADARPEYRNLCRKAFPGPSLKMQLLVGEPILLMAWLWQAIPWIAYLFFLVRQPWFVSGSERRSVYRLLVWFATGNRLAWYVCIRQPIRAVVSPLFYLSFCIMIKKLVIGKFKAGPRPTDDWGRMRHWIMKELLPGGNLNGVAALVGTHYEIISMIYRALGSKVGKRVYWPGSGMLGLYEYDLFEVGDDVVFGSRTTVIPCDATEAAPIKLGAGSMVADRCVLLPGFSIGRNGLLGSGGLGAKHQALAPGSKWLGSTGGSAVCIAEGTKLAAEADTVRPFGRAFYEGVSSGYYVMSLWQHVVFNTTVVACGAILWKLPLFAALEAAEPFDEGNVRSLLFYFYGWFLAINGALSVAMLFLDVGFKWAVMGQRRPGRYNWDESSYSQRWQLYIALHSLARCGESTHLLQLLTGSAYMVRYYRALGATIGRDVCLYPNYADPPMTEPDVVTINDGCVIDDCSLVGHINSYGDFSINPVTVGAGSTLRAYVRMLSGASTEENARLLEHTLVVSGDVVNAGATWQGWPAQVVEPGFEEEWNAV